MKGQCGTLAASDVATYPVARIGRAIYESARQEGGMITLQDGTGWQFIFGGCACHAKRRHPSGNAAAE